MVLALVQGITEFLPISSHGHLILTRDIMEIPGPGLIIDIAVHVGTLLAVMLYFWREMGMLVIGALRLAIGRGGPNAILVVNLAIGTLPLIAAGLLIHRHAINVLRDPAIVAWTTLIFGVVLFLADRYFLTVRRIEHMSFGSAFLIGLAQVLALVPGTSRSGITITAARFLGFERAEAARFSLLLSVPAIIGAATLVGFDLYELGDVQLQIDALIAAGLSFIVALAAIAAMMGWLKRATFTPFVVYRVVLGVGLLIWIYS